MTINDNSDETAHGRSKFSERRYATRTNERTNEVIANDVRKHVTRCSIIAFYAPLKKSVENNVGGN